MIMYRAFYDKDYQFLKLLTVDSDKIQSYSLNHKVVFWEDIVSDTEKDAIRRAKLLGKIERSRRSS